MKFEEQIATQLGCFQPDFTQRVRTNAKEMSVFLLCAINWLGLDVFLEFDLHVLLT